jgi:hypothetical protein
MRRRGKDRAADGPVLVCSFRQPWVDAAVHDEPREIVDAYVNAVLERGGDEWTHRRLADPGRSRHDENRSRRHPNTMPRSFPAAHPRLWTSSRHPGAHLSVAPAPGASGRPVALTRSQLVVTRRAGLGHPSRRALGRKVPCFARAHCAGMVEHRLSPLARSQPSPTADPARRTPRVRR